MISTRTRSEASQDRTKRKEGTMKWIIRNLEILAWMYPGFVLVVWVLETHEKVIIDGYLMKNALVRS